MHGHPAPDTPWPTLTANLAISHVPTITITITTTTTTTASRPSQQGLASKHRHWVSQGWPSEPKRAYWAVKQWLA